MAERDATTGKFAPGNQAAKGKGRPPGEIALRLNTALDGVLDRPTLTKWQASMKRRLAKGDQWATEFVFNRTLGKVPDKTELTGADGAALFSFPELIAALAAAEAAARDDGPDAAD
jgi:hypothetical protein